MAIQEGAKPRRMLVTAASMHGATAGIAGAIGEALAAHGLDISVIPPDHVHAVEEYDGVILGSAVYTGHWLKPVIDLVSRSREALARRPVWLFSSGPVGHPDSKLTQGMWKDPVSLPAIMKATNAWDHRMFAGRLDPKILSRWHRAELLVLRGLEGDFRDWAAIRQWADCIAREFSLAPR